ncbi:MAG: Tat pathway signal protein [Eggerthellaceae bacterium]|nr:Tat pathway signal protein [Eggerthellaceae bacterium]
MLVTRRKFLYGAIGVGAVAIAGASAAVLGSRSDDNEVTYLDAPDDALTSLTDFEALDSEEGKVSKIGEYDLPYGTLVWANDDSVAACLLPTETGKPLTQIGVLALGSGTLTTVLEQAVGSKEGFEVYDVRATSTGAIWTEADVLEGTWRIYSARLSNGTLVNPIKIDEGDTTYDTPTIAAVGEYAFWQVLPKLPNDQGLTSQLKKATIGAPNSSVIFENARRMGTPLYAAEDSVVITPRVDSPSIFYQLTKVAAKSGEVEDTLTLPGAMHPLEAGYGRNGFTFSFADIYNYGGAIKNMGTYTPLEKPKDGDYDNAKWFGFARTPTAPPAWCKDLFIVKSSYSVCGVDLKKGEYFALDVDNGADSYGEYLASSGVHDKFVTYTNIDYSPVGSDAVKTCRVKVWTTV